MSAMPECSEFPTLRGVQSSKHFLPAHTVCTVYPTSSRSQVPSARLVGDALVAFLMFATSDCSDLRRCSLADG